MNLIRSAKSKVRSLADGARSKSASNGNGHANGGSDILATLKKEHEEVASMLEQLVSTESGAERKKLVKQIKAALVPHLKAEEKVVYKAITKLRDKEARQDGEEGIIEHRLAINMLSSFGKAGNATSPQFSAAAKVLKELVSHHVEEEETNIWKDIRENFSDEDRIAMNERFETAKGKVRVA
jgi:hemerythrin-like domain-containing protein